MHGTKTPLGAKKHFGQHFLRDTTVIQKILDATPFEEGEKIVEIGPGRGALTEPLYAKLEEQGREGDLVLIELDRDLVDDLRTRFPLAQVHQADATKGGWREYTDGKSWVLLSNLPYNAGTAIVNDIFWGDHPPEHATVMLQKEVGERIIAVPPQMSVLSVALQLKTTGKRICTVKPGAFVPPPKVDSVVIALTRRKEENQNDKAIIALAKEGFAHARKQLRQTLVKTLGMQKEEIGKLLEVEGLSPLARPEELSLKTWERLAEYKK